jgi:hypothetical protein
MSTKDLDIDQKELFKNANRRVKQKKRLVYHLVFFIAGALVLMFLNLVLQYQDEFRPFGLPWYVTAILIWSFFFIAHAINVFFVEKLMGRAWEEKYMNKLVELQLKKLKKLQAKVDKKYPLEDANTQESTPQKKTLDNPDKNDKT